TGMLILWLTWMVDRNVLLWLIIGGTLFSFATFRYKRFYLLHKTSDASLGTLFYPLGILGAYLLLWNYPLYYFQVALLILVVSDTVANIIGQIKNGNGNFRILRDSKSMHGIAGYVATSLVVFFLFLPLHLLADPFYLFSLLTVAVALEVLSWRGSDNFSIPVGMAIFFYLSEAFVPSYLWMALVLLGMTAGSFFLYHQKMLTLQGTLAAWLLGNYLMLTLGLQWVIPVLLFFFSSVLFTRLRARRVGKKGRGDSRNAWQVTANILWAVISSALWLASGKDIFIFLFIAYVAAVTADTWASELGPLFNRRSFSLADGRWHPAGVTGGISLAGTLAALMGSFAISSVSWWLFFGQWNTEMIALLTLAAFLACFADTLLGTFVEHRLLSMSCFRNRNSHEAITPNDLVNLGGSLTAGLFVGMGMGLFF
ncbi:MAG: DUF92 domain-containing protein, partial [bacterium]